MSGSLLILNITSEDVKMAEISHENGDRLVRRLYHYQPEKENKIAPIRGADVVKKFIQEDSPKTLKTLLVINSQDLDYKDFSFPFDSPKKVTKAINFEISSQYPPNGYIIDHIKNITRTPGKKSFLAAIAGKEMLTKRIKEAEDAGLQIVGITSDISTLGKFFRDENEVLVMEMGESQTLFALYTHGMPLLVRDIPIGIKEFGKGSQKLDRTKLKPFTGEIKRTIHSFNSRTGLSLKKVFVSGNILFQQEILNALKETLDLEFIDQVIPGIGFKTEKQREDSNIYASLLGAAEWKRNGTSFNFFKDEFARSDPGAIGRNYIRWGAMILVFFLFAVFSSLWLKIVTLEKRKNFLTTDIRETFKAAYPHTKRIVDEVRQAKNFLDAIKFELVGGDPSSERLVLDVLDKISRTISKETNFQIMTLFWERGKLEISGKTDSFKTVNNIQELLSNAPDFSGVNISNAKSKGDGESVEFKITIRLAEKI